MAFLNSKAFASLRYRLSMLDPGAAYPPFNLVDHADEPFDSSQLSDAWFLLYWYPMADTPGCTAQALGLRDQIEAFDELGCRVLGASFDAPRTNTAFRDKYHLPFTLLSDPDRELAALVGAGSTEDGHARRIAHLVSPQGAVAKAYAVDNPEFFAEDVLDDLESALDDSSA